MIPFSEFRKAKAERIMEEIDVDKFRAFQKRMIVMSRVLAQVTACYSCDSDENRMYFNDLPRLMGCSLEASLKHVHEGATDIDSYFTMFSHSRFRDDDEALLDELEIHWDELRDLVGVRTLYRYLILVDDTIEEDNQEL